MISQENFNIVDKIAKSLGVPTNVWLPIVNYESGGDPNNRTVTGKEDSRGLFQVNLMAHPDANPSMLFDAEYNAKYQLPELKKFYDMGVNRGLKGAELTKYVARYGQRPDWKDPKNVSYITGSIDKYFGNESSISSSDIETQTVGWNGRIFKEGGTMGDIEDDIKGLFNIENFFKKYLYVMGLIVFLMFTVYMVFVHDTKTEKLIVEGAKKL